MTRNWFICVGGFTQTRGTGNGVLALSEKLRRFQNPETNIEFLAWCDDMAAMATEIDELAKQARAIPGNEKFTPNICIFAYSYGGGYGAPRLVFELWKRGLRVRAIVLSDPVWRFKIPGLGRFGRLFEWVAAPISGMTLFGKITFRPKEIGTIFWFYQRQGSFVDGFLNPQGREPVCLGAEIHAGELLDYPHASMDDAVEWHEKCLEVAGDVLQKSS